MCVCALCLRLCGMLCDVWCIVGGFVCLCVGMLVCEFVYHWVGIGLSGCVVMWCCRSACWHTLLLG